MMKTIRRLAVGLALVAGLSGSEAWIGTAGAGIYVPKGLKIGQSYHLAFVTNGTRDATSNDIADYDAFVQAAADAAGLGASEGVDWYAVGSTAAVQAIDHILIDAPVYLLNDRQLAKDANAFWTGAWGKSMYLNVDENGNPVKKPYDVWTGSKNAGILGYGLGNASSTNCNYTRTDQNGSTWLSYGIGKDLTAKLHFYAVSEKLTLSPPPAVPEPSALSLWALIASSAFAFGWYRNRKR